MRRLHSTHTHTPITRFLHSFPVWLLFFPLSSQTIRLQFCDARRRDSSAMIFICINPDTRLVNPLIGFVCFLRHAWLHLFPALLLLSYLSTPFALTSSHNHQAPAFRIWPFPKRQPTCFGPEHVPVSGSTRVRPKWFFENILHNLLFCYMTECVCA